MRIALVAPSAVPYTVGGAEKLWWGLTTHVNRHTPHAMELVKLPSPERNFREVVESYRQFSTLSLDHFDMVISTKYPAWMVRHDHHVVYLQHRLRGLYDTYPEHLPLRPDKLPPAVEPLWRLLQRQDLDRAALPELFGRLDALLASRDLPDGVVERLTAFPGPLARAVVHALDRVALSPTAIRRYCAISRTVTQREGYFPAGVHVDVVPHPSDLEGFHDAPGEFVFTASRLDGPKRLDLLVRAYRRCRIDTPLVIAGEGPAGDALRALADGDPRIRFTGRLTDDALVSHYARAHFVVFVPFQEDMGLVTLEAMKSGKPVLTVGDAGGVTEFVRDGVNGRVVPPDEASLAHAIDAMMADRDRLAAMGAAARATGAEVTWQRTVDTLLGAPGAAPAPAAVPGTGGQPAAGPQPARGPRILALNTFGVFPPTSGGRKRIFYLFEALSRHADVTLLNLGAPGGAPEMREFGSRYREIRIPPGDRFQAAEAALQRALRKPVTDIAALLHADEIPRLGAALAELAANADVVVANHVYLAPLIARHWTGELWYDAHNVEADMKADILGVERLAAPFAGTGAGTAAGATSAAAVVAQVASAERALVRSATRVLAASAEDAQRFAELYGRDPATIELAPNGVALPDDPWLEPERRARLKATLGFDGRPVALFVGSDHGPNHDAADLVIAAAQSLPHWSFWVAGSICDYERLRDAPDHVFRLGVVAEAELTALFRAADAGLNPMLRGSGTNLKMLDYAAHGALVLSTEVGARGLGFVAGTHYVPTAPERLAQTLDALVPELPSPRLAMRTAARRHVEAHFSWRTIADRIAAAAGGA
jgi:glycosyltransferase involved in cell wall biosynthesis